MKKITILMAMLFVTAIGFSQTIVYTQDFEGATIPTGWTDQNVGDGVHTWTFGDGVIAGSGVDNDFPTFAAIFDDDAAGNTGDHDYRYLWYGPSDVSALSNVSLSYEYALNVLGDNLELMHVSLWDNTNAAWIDITTYVTDTNPTADSIDISAAMVANPGIDASNFFFAFGYDDLDGGWAWAAGADNVELSGTAASGNQMFIHTATAANISGNLTVIDHPDLNGNPNAKIVASHNWETGITLNENTVGVWYNGSNWTVFNEDAASAMVENVSFGIYIDGIDSTTYTHISDASNQGVLDAYSIIDDASVNGNPNAIIVLGTYWNPFIMYNPDPYGVFYDMSINKWTIFNEEINPIPTNAAFNVVLAPDGSEVKAIQHQANAANTLTYYTIVDNPYLNGNPDAKIVLTHNWGSVGDVSNVIVTNTQSVWYHNDTSRWRIFNDDLTDMNDNTLFNLLVTNDTAAGISENELNANFTIYPNPVNDVLRINTQLEVSNVIIYNLLGQEVKSSIPATSDINMDLSDLNAGVYIVKIISNDNEYSKRFIKK